MHAAPAAQNLPCEAAASAVVGAATVVTSLEDAVVAASVDLAAFVVTVISAAGRMTFELSLAATGLFTKGVILAFILVADFLQFFRPGVS